MRRYVRELAEVLLRQKAKRGLDRGKKKEKKSLTISPRTPLGRARSPRHKQATLVGPAQGNSGMVARKLMSWRFRGTLKRVALKAGGDFS